MRVFIAGTDTEVGKTMISSWLCLHTGYAYFKPIQTGCLQHSDRQTVHALSTNHTYPESYRYQRPISPHLAAAYEQDQIELKKISLPDSHHLIIEGTGGLLVPICPHTFMIDVMQQFQTPVILVARSTLGTINHTLLSLAALRARSMMILGVIVNGERNQDTCDSIADYGQTTVLAQMPFLPIINTDTLYKIPLSNSLKKIFEK